MADLGSFEKGKEVYLVFLTNASKVGWLEGRTGWSGLK